MLQAMQKLMQQQGIRRLLVLSGEPTWCYTQAQQLAAPLPGDWLRVGTHSSLPQPRLQSGAVRTLLGQEKLHAIFDATQGMDVEALAQLCGILQAGSWLLLLVPSWPHWPQWQDADSLRWSNCSHPISTPNFINHLQQQLSADHEVTLWRQGEPLHLSPLSARPAWQASQGEPNAEQQAILARLLTAEAGVWVLTAARGRGKSTVAGMLMACSPLTCWLTGPSRAATDVASGWAAGRGQFLAPDALLQYCNEHSVADIGWLLIDEAAAIPGPLLQRLIGHFPRVLLTTTVQGYEGTGRGFLLKFCAALPQWQPLSLQVPMRWAADDPLERIIDNILLFKEQTVWPSANSTLKIDEIEQSELCSAPKQLARFYALLSSAHYRTSPLDLRRLMDAPGMHFSAASLADDVVGLLWLSDEGGLTAELAQQIWAGHRRPRGNLVAQSLAAHGGQWRAPTLRSRRITRIAVLPEWRRQGIARRLIEQQKQPAQALDFLSVSFGYTEPLWHFWQSCGFTLVRIGSRHEASSGCYSAMAIFPLSKQGAALCHAAYEHLRRDWHWLQQRIDLQLEMVSDEADIALNSEDWRELAGFAFASRPLEASLGALQRLLLATELPLSALRCHLQQQQSVAQCTALFNLSGQKAMLRHWRHEVALALEQHDEQRCQYWHDWVSAC